MITIAMSQQAITSCRQASMKTFLSDLSGKSFPVADKIAGRDLQKSLFEFIQRSNPAFGEDACLGLSELNLLRKQYVAEFLEHEVMDLSGLQQTVVNALNRDALLTNELENEDAAPLTAGQRLADKVASFGGSWRFIISFGIFILIWIVLNVVFLLSRAFDPYPFILLNLILSCIASLQAPVIMMSQNRQEEKDRERSRKDYMINLKSELEIRILHDKIDHLILHQQRQLIEIQKMQVDMMNEILAKMDRENADTPDA
jgi:uncharacterized membrane protein